jgi:SOS-response transcriptional repressor LexA
MFVADDPRVRTIESLLNKYGLSNRWLATKLGKNHTSVNDWLDPAGSKPRDMSIYDRMLQVIKSEGPPSADVKLARAGVRFIPVYSTIAAGNPSTPTGDVDYEEMIDWGSDFERWGRVIEGDSMIHILQPGDIAVFEDRQHENGDVVHAFSSGTDCVKAIRGEGALAQLWSFNEDFPPFTAHDWSAKGVCVARIRYGRYKIRQVTEFPGGLKWSMRNEQL